MAIQADHRTQSRPLSLIERLVRERGLQRFGLFLVVGEGKALPNGDEDQSGFVIDESGQVYAFWTDWDVARQAVELSEWEPVDDDPVWHDVAEYQRARRQAGL